MLGYEGHAQCWAPREIRAAGAVLLQRRRRFREMLPVTGVEINAWAEEGTERAAQDKWERKSDSHCPHVESPLESQGLHGACHPNYGENRMEP